MTELINSYLEVSKDVQFALDHGLPIVALESTIISHGMPHPRNVKTALEVEEVVRKNGATPATIAIISGKLKVGLTTKEIEYLGSKGMSVHKTSRRDLPYLISQKLDGATTVAATMYIASLVGIKVFATGGIGGVHRGASSSFDISADLQELQRTSVAVVCAGVKSILDLGLTLEYLETYGVPVIGVNVDRLPAFYTRESEFKVNFNIKEPEGIADFLRAKWDIGLDGGVVIANPIEEKFSYNSKEINEVIARALKEMDELGIKGKETTPYLLSKISDMTEGKSLDANISLVLNNAKVASHIATSYSK